eukprot:scaffold1872_cov262-Amphora_coffeaeformis.AAC.4
MTRPDRTEKPKRCLTAYNFFFQEERQRLLDSLPSRPGCAKPKRSHGKIGFQDLARAISARWKTVTLEEKAVYQELANTDKQRYLKEMDDWRAALEEENERELNIEDEKAPGFPQPTSFPGNTRSVSGLSSPESQCRQVQQHLLQCPPQLMHHVHEAPQQLSCNIVNFAQPPPRQQYQIQQAPVLNDALLLDNISADFWDIHDPPAIQAHSNTMSVLEPQPIQEQNIVPTLVAGAMERFLMADLANKLDQDCQDFLITAFAR